MGSVRAIPTSIGICTRAMSSATGLSQDQQNVCKLAVLAFARSKRPLSIMPEEEGMPLVGRHVPEVSAPRVADPMVDAFVG